MQGVGEAAPGPMLLGGALPRHWMGQWSPAELWLPVFCWWGVAQPAPCLPFVWSPSATTVPPDPRCGCDTWNLEHVYFARNYGKCSKTGHSASHSKLSPAKELTRRTRWLCSNSVCTVNPSRWQEQLAKSSITFHTGYRSAAPFWNFAFTPVCATDTQIDWCCLHYFVTNSRVAFLEALCARIFFFRFVNISFFWFFFCVCKVSNKDFLPPLSDRLLCLVVSIPLVCWLCMCACVCVPLYVHVEMCR